MKKFRLQNKEGNDVLGGLVKLEHVYISCYGKVIKGKAPKDLEVDEFCIKEYSLSGQKATEYIIVRVQ